MSFLISISSLWDVLWVFLPVSTRQPPCIKDLFGSCSCSNSFDPRSTAVQGRQRRGKGWLLILSDAGLLCMVQQRADAGTGTAALQHALLRVPPHLLPAGETHELSARLPRSQPHFLLGVLLLLLPALLPALPTVHDFAGQRRLRRKRSTTCENQLNYKLNYVAALRETSRGWEGRQPSTSS